MDLRKAMYEQLSSLAGLTALVGNRIYPARKPQGAVFPQVTYLLDESRQWDLAGPNGFSWAVFALDFWALTSDEKDAAAMAAKGRKRGVSTTALDGFQGWFGGAHGVCVQSGRIQDDMDVDIPNDDLDPRDGSDQGVFRCRLSFEMFFAES